MLVPLRRRRAGSRVLSVLTVAVFLLAELGLLGGTAFAQSSSSTCDPADGSCLGALIGQINQITEAELDQKKDGQGRNLFIDATTYAGQGRTSWNRDGVELEATKRLVCLDNGQPMDRSLLFKVMRTDPRRPDSPWRPFRRMRNPEQMEAFSLRYGIDEMPWGDDAHDLREQMPYIYVTVSNSRNVFDPEVEEMVIGNDDNEQGIVVGPRTLELSTDVNDDYYFDTKDYVLLENNTLIRGRMRWNDWRNPTVAGRLRMLIASKVILQPDPSDPLAVKGALKQDQRRDGARQQDVDGLREAVQRGFLSWDTNAPAAAIKAVYEDLADKGKLPDIGRYQDVLAMDPKVFIRSVRSRFHFDEVQRNNMVSLHNLGATQLNQLKAEAEAAIAASSSAADRAAMQAFVDAVDGIDAAIVSRTGLSAAQVRAAKTAISAGRAGSATRAQIEQQKAVSHTLSDIYHELGTMLGADDRALTRLIVTSPGGDDGAADFQDWLTNQTENRRAGSLRGRGLTADNGQVKIPTPSAVKLTGNFTNIEISTDGGSSWSDAAPDQEIESDGDEVEFELREKPGTQGSGNIQINAELPTNQATQFRQFRQFAPFAREHARIMGLPQAQKQAQIDAFNAYHESSLTEDEFAVIGQELEWQDKRRWYKQIEAAGTVAKGLWFDNARQHYVPSSSRSSGNFFIDTIDLAGYYTPSATGDDPDDDNLFSGELVNEVQIELGKEKAYVDRIRALSNTIDRDRASAFLKWATSHPSLPANPDDAAYKALFEELAALDDAALQPIVDEVNAAGAAAGSPWATTGADHPSYPLTVSDFRTLNTLEDGEADRMTTANRDRAVRTDTATEFNRAGAQFVFDEYRRAQKFMSDAKREQVFDGVNWAIRRARRQGLPIPECDEWGWIDSDAAKGERGLGLLKAKEGGTVQPPPVQPPPVQPPPVQPPPVVSRAEAEPNDSISAVRSPGANLLSRGADFIGAIESRSDVDFVKIEFPFNANHGSPEFKVTMSPPAGQDYDLEVLDSNGNRMPNGLSEEPDDSEESVTITPQGGARVFYVRVYGWDGANSATPYTLKADWTPQPTN